MLDEITLHAIGCIQRGGANGSTDRLVDRILSDGIDLSHAEMTTMP